MSLPSIAFYGDTPVTIAGERGRLALEETLAADREPVFCQSGLAAVGAVR